MSSQTRIQTIWKENVNYETKGLCPNFDVMQVLVRTFEFNCFNYLIDQECVKRRCMDYGLWTLSLFSVL